MVKGQLLFVLKHTDSCLNCSGSGLVAAISPPIPDTENYPHVGGGIGGVALAVACLHRGFRLPFTNAITAEARWGYGLTLQQASKAIEGWVFLIRRE
jgi:hypothetical protein